MAPPTINLDDPEDDLGIEIAVKPTELHQRGPEPMAVLNNSFGFGGSNVAVVFTAA
jgi:3-oxoacyl-[acyl-carrier-protein] synthase II